MALKTVVDVFLQGESVPAMRISFLYCTLSPLFTGGHVLLQASGPFHRMLPYSPAAACHDLKDTAYPQQKDATYEEGRRSHGVNRCHPSAIERLQQS